MRCASASLPLATKTLALAMIAGFALTASAAHARPSKKYNVERSADRSSDESDSGSEDERGRWRSGSAAIIVDGNTGKVLYEENADALRHPASVTKVMTLYLLFEQLEAGNLKLTSQLPVSAKASAQQPSKLGLAPGSTIEVEDAIKAIVTRSANDVAVVIAEAIGGSESGFAELMTAKAQSLGMRRTTYRNASGLPNPNQLTTARDLSILGRAVQDRFPKYYKYFSTRTFYYRGRAIGNHNRLLGRVDGVDGIKTGYTRASGFNLLTSVKRGDRYLVGVVLGGRSGGSRDNRMADLIGDYLPRAYAGRRTAPMVAERGDGAAPDQLALAAPLPQAADRDEMAPRIAPLPPARQMEVRQAALDGGTTEEPDQGDEVETASLPEEPQVRAGSNAPITPTAVKTVAIQRPTQAKVASFSTTPGVLGYLSSSSQTMVDPVREAENLAKARAAARAVAGEIPMPAAQANRRITGTNVARADQATGRGSARVAGAPVRTASLVPMVPAPRPEKATAAAAPVKDQDRVPAQRPQAAAPAKPAEPQKVASLAPAAPKAAPEPAPAAAKAAEKAADQRPASARSGWVIQIGAYDRESEARAKLDLARSKMKGAAGSADPYTEKVTKGSTELYRARFAGFDDQDSANRACRLLKRNDFACISLRN